MHYFISPVTYGKGLLIAICLTVNWSNDTLAAEAYSEQDFRVLKNLSAGDGDLLSAQQAAAQLHQQGLDIVIPALSAMKDATPIGKNWLASIASLEYSKAKAAGKVAAIHSELESFLAEQSNDPEARTLVFHWLTSEDAAGKEERLLKMTSDSSSELRFAAIEAVLGSADDFTVDQLSELLDTARHPDQVRGLVKRLADKGKTIDQSHHFGFIKDWNLIGPFDNRGEKHFDTEYEVESDLIQGNFDLSKKYAGKNGEVAWQQHHTDDEEGKVNLAEIYAQEKGAVVYAYVAFKSPAARDADVRLTSINANKLWLNGELVLANQMYHAGTMLDQYVGHVRLNEGTNHIVVKLLQNEQTDSWAQDYQFHLRVTDETGKAIYSE